MPKVIRLYVHYVDAFNAIIGKIMMYVVFVMMAILLFSAIGRTVFNLSLIWTVESAQFTMAAYYLIGGAYSLIMQGHVRMDLVYSRCSRRTQGGIDAVTDILFLFYLGILVVGGISSVEYALEYNQTSRSSWGPPLAPIKIAMVAGILLMLLEAVSRFFKDVAIALGRDIEEHEEASNER